MPLFSRKSQAVLTTPTRKRVLKRRPRMGGAATRRRLNDTDPQEGTETALSDRLGRALFSLNDTDPQEGTETFYLCDGQAVIQLS